MISNQLTLTKNEITLHALKEEHIHPLTQLASEKIIWEYVPEQLDHPAVFKKDWFQKALQQMDEKSRLCFVISYGHQIVGSSSYYEIDLQNKKTNIGYTWFHPSTWGTKVNPLSKLIMLEYAFETLNLNRVGFSIDSINERSCRALKKLGIKHEGVLRNHLLLSDKRIRHSVMFSVIHDEWIETKKNIEKIIERL